MSTYLLYRDQKDRLRLDAFIRTSKIAHGEHLPNDMTKVQMVLQWGSRDERSTNNSLKTTWMNEEAALQRLFTFEIRSLLSMNGVRMTNKQFRNVPSQLYRVFVFNLRAIQLYRGMQPLEWDVTCRTHRLLRRTAVKAVYAAGLDFAEVVIHAQTDQQTVVRIDPTPFITQELANRWTDALRQYELEMKEQKVQVQQMSIGSDIELLLRNEKGRVVFASHFLKRKGRVGCDGIRLRNRQFIFPLVELRPDPKNDPRKLIDEIYKMMQLAQRKIHASNLQWLSGGMPIPGFALGGHLHFGNVTLSNELLRVLDNYLALLFVMIEGENEIKRRPKYGFLGDFREKEYGFEYRTLPSWLDSPKLALAVCSLAHLLTSHYRSFHQRPLKELEIQKSFYDGNKEALHKHAKNIIEELIRFPAFKSYAPAITPFFTRVLTMEAIESTVDIRPNWRLV